MNDDNFFFKIKSNIELMKNLKFIKFNINEWKKFKNLFIEYFNKYNLCEKNANLNLCQQNFQGYKYYFNFQNNELFLTRIECNHILAFQEKNRIKNNYLIKDFNDNLLKLRLKNINEDQNFHNTKIIVNEMIKFVRGIRKKGLFIYGNPGVGKTYLLIRLSNTLANNNFKIAFISVINLINRIKESFSNMFNQYLLINNILKADVIFLDDIGGEIVSAWTRDDLLFSILNECIIKNKPIFFSSNFSLNKLSIIYSNNKNNYNNYYIDNIKAQRIIDRIYYLANEIKLFGKSRRKNI